MQDGKNIGEKQIFSNYRSISIPDIPIILLFYAEISLHLTSKKGTLRRSKENEA